MNVDIAEGKWKDFVGKVKEQWGALADDDMVEAHGAFERLTGKLQLHYGLAKDEAEHELKKIARQISSN